MGLPLAQSVPLSSKRVVMIDAPKAPWERATAVGADADKKRSEDEAIDFFNMASLVLGMLGYFFKVRCLLVSCVVVYFAMAVRLVFPFASGNAGKCVPLPRAPPLLLHPDPLIFAFSTPQVHRIWTVPRPHSSVGRP